MSDANPVETTKEVAKATGEIAKATGEIVRAVTANRDLANEAAKTSPGQEVLGKIRTENLIMRSLIENTFMKGVVRVLFRHNQYVTSGQIYQDLAAKLEVVPPDQIQPPKASIIGPAIEGLTYALDEPALKDLYLNLLASAMTTSVANKVHPSFANILGMLSPEEVPALDFLLRRSVLRAAKPRIELQEALSLYYMADRQAAQSLSVFIEASDSSSPFTGPDVSMWVANWERLGLVELQLDGEIVARDDLDVTAWGWAVHRPEFLAAEAFAESIVPREVAAVGIERGVIRVTPLGERFFETVCDPRDNERTLFDAVYRNTPSGGATRVRVSSAHETLIPSSPATAIRHTGAWPNG